MEVDDAFLVGLDDFLGEQEAVGDVLGDLARHIVALDAVDDRILVAVLLLDILVLAFQKREDAGIGGVRVTGKGAVVSVADVGAGDLIGSCLHQFGLDHVLDFLDGRGPVAFLATGSDELGDLLDALLVQFGCRDCLVGLADGLGDLGVVEFDFSAVTLDDFHMRSQCS